MSSFSCLYAPRVLRGASGWRGVGGVVCSIVLLALLSLTSYGSGGGVISALPSPILGASSIRTSATSAIPTSIFTPSRTKLGRLSISGRGGDRPTGGRAVTKARSTSHMLHRTGVASSARDISSTCTNISHIIGCSFARQSIPRTFRNFHVTFISSLRCGDLLGRRKLGGLIHLLVTRGTSILLVKNSCRRNYRCIRPLFTTLSHIGAPVKACNMVKGGSCRHYRSRVIHAVGRCKVEILRRRMSALQGSNRRVVVTNMHGPFSLARGNISPALTLSPGSFIVLLMRAPSCVRSISITGASLTLTKRARNKRIHIFKITPILGSRCKGHFLAKLTCGATGVPLVVAGKVNASRLPVHVNTPTRIMVVALRQLTR